MADLHELLDRRAEAFRPAPDGLERIRRRARSRRRNRQLLAGGLAMAVFAGSAAGLWIAFGRGGAPPHPPASNTVTTTPLPGEPSDIAAGEGAVWVAVPHEVLRLDSTTGEIVTSIPVPGTGQLAVGFGSVWVTNFHQDSVTRIDATTNAVQTTIPVGPLPFEVAPGDRVFLPFDIATGEGAVWVDTARGEVVRIDPTTNAVANVVRLDPEGPGAIAAGEGSVWVTGTLQPGAVWRIGPRTGEVAQTIGVGSQPVSIEAGAGSAWVAVGFDRDHRRLVRIDAGTGVATTVVRGVGLGPIAVTPETVWVADGAGNVSQIDPQTGQTTSLGMVTGKRIGFLTVTNDALWATGYDDQTVTRVDRACLGQPCAKPTPSGGLTVRPGNVRTYSIPALPRDIAVGEGSLWIAADHDVVAVDPDTGAWASIPTHKEKRGFPGTGSIAVGSGAVWETDTKAGRVYRVDPRTGRVVGSLVTGKFGCGSAASGIAADRFETWISARDCRTGWATRINTTTNEFDTDHQVNVGRDPAAIGVNGSDVWVVREHQTGELDRIDGSTGRLVTELLKGEHPRALAVTSNAVWVATASQVVRIDPATNGILARIDLAGVRDLAATSDGAWAIRGGPHQGELVQLDARTNAVVGDPIRLNEYLGAVAVDPSAVWVAGLDGPSLFRVQLLRGSG